MRSTGRRASIRRASPGPGTGGAASNARLPGGLWRAPADAARPLMLVYLRHARRSDAMICAGTWGRHPVLSAARGSGGFSYDPLFQPADCNGDGRRTGARRQEPAEPPRPRAGGAARAVAAGAFERQVCGIALTDGASIDSISGSSCFRPARPGASASASSSTSRSSSSSARSSPGRARSARSTARFLLAADRRARRARRMGEALSLVEVELRKLQDHGSTGPGAGRHRGRPASGPAQRQCQGRARRCRTGRRQKPFAQQAFELGWIAAEGGGRSASRRPSCGRRP